METTIIKEARAVQKYLRRAPRKLRLVADVVRGQRVDKALDSLKFINKAGAVDVSKVIRSAAANLQDKNDESSIDMNAMRIKTIMVDEGPTLKRIQPAPQGRAHPIRKRMSHITVVVEAIDEFETNDEE
ncbi:MAG: 50S ribosomal protein L22 [Balneolales bacterium]|nr:50S ribosomal protein L22 [Balneolales bacterium]